MTDPLPADVPVALLGAGRWGRTVAAAIGATPGIALAAAISANPETREFIGPGIPVFDDWRDAMDGSPAAGVIVAVPPDRQPDIAVALIENGVPAMLEKPLAMSAADAERILAAARRHGFRGLVDHLHLYTPHFAALTGSLEDIDGRRIVNAAAGADGPVRSGWSSLWDWAAHDIAMTLTATNRAPAEVTAALDSRIPDSGGARENYRIDMSFADGSTARLVVGNAFDRRTRDFCVEAGGRERCYRESATGAISASIDGNVLNIEDNGRPLRPLNAALSVFAGRIRDGGGIGDIELGVRVVRIVEAAEKSAGSGRPVRLSVEKT